MYINAVFRQHCSMEYGARVVRVHDYFGSLRDTESFQGLAEVISSLLTFLV